MKRKLLTIILCMATSACMIPQSAFAVVKDDAKNNLQSQIVFFNEFDEHEAVCSFKFFCVKREDIFSFDFRHIELIKKHDGCFSHILCHNDSFQQELACIKLCSSFSYILNL